MATGFLDRASVLECGSPLPLSSHQSTHTISPKRGKHDFITRSLGIVISTLLATSSPAQSGPASLQLAPAYPPIPASFWELHHWPVIGCAVVAILCLGILLWLWLTPAPVPVVPPEIKAQAALRKLSGRPETGACLSAISQILRHYFAAAFALPAAELTTAEFCAALDAQAEVGPELAAHVADFLRQCDTGKFAAPPQTITFKAVDRALELVTLAGDRRRFLQAQIAASGKGINP